MLAFLGFGGLRLRVGLGGLVRYLFSLRFAGFASSVCVSGSSIKLFFPGSVTAGPACIFLMKLCHGLLLGLCLGLLLELLLMGLALGLFPLCLSKGLLLPGLSG